MDRKYSAIIFDCGGVLFLDDNMADLAGYLAPKYGVSFEELNELLAEKWYATRTDKNNDPEFWASIARELGIGAQQVREEFLSFPRFQPDVAELARGLGRNYKVAMLSNQLHTWLEPLLDRHGLADVFDPVIGSYTANVAKPDPRAYQTVLDQLSAHPTECIFIDDRESNLPPAQEMGITTILFKNPGQLIEELKALGVIVEDR